MNGWEIVTIRYVARYRLDEHVRIKLTHPESGQTARVEIFGDGYFREVRYREQDGSTRPSALSEEQAKGIGLNTELLKKITDQTLYNVNEWRFIPFFDCQSQRLTGFTSKKTCKWRRDKDLIWLTSCDHSIGTPRKWEPIEGMACICCKKPVEVEHEHIEQSVRV